MSDGNGGLPEGWQVATIEEHCVLNPKHDRNMSEDIEVSFVPMAAVSDVHGTITDPQVRQYGEVRKGFTHFADGDVIFAKITPCMENGKAASVRGMTNGLACGTTEFYVFRSRGAVDQDYLFHFVRQESYRKAARAQMQSGVGQARVPKDFVLNTTLPTPPLAEQHRIVSKIESLQERSSRARRALSAVGPLLEQLRQSVLAAAFRGDLTADWREAHPDVEPASELLKRIRIERRERWEKIELTKYKAKGKQPPKDWQHKYKEPEPVDDPELPALPDGWCWVCAEEVCEYITKGTTPPKDKMTQDKGEVRFLKVGNLTFTGALDFSKENAYIDSETNCTGVYARSRIYPGDVLMNLVGPPLGKVSLIPPEIEQSNVNQAIAIFRPIAGIHASFLTMSLTTPSILERIVRRAKQTSGQRNLTLDLSRRLPLPLAPCEEQLEIASQVQAAMLCVDGVEDCRATSESELTQLEQSILAKAFRGELVPQNPNDEPASVLLERIRTTRDTGAAAKNAKKKVPRKKAAKK